MDRLRHGYRLLEMPGSVILTFVMIAGFFALPSLCEGVAPNEVIVYEHIHFTGQSQSYKLEPGMRQKLVPYVGDALNDKISSIEVGSDVAVTLWPDADFQYQCHFCVDFTDTYFDSQFDIASLASSLIVFPKQLRQPIGVELTNLAYTNNIRFFPLSESLSDTETQYPTLGSMDDDANRLQLFPNDFRSSAYGKVEAVLCENPNFTGRQLTFAYSDTNPNGFFDMTDYNFNDAASSLIVRWNPNAQKPIDPYEVVVYEHANYVTEQPVPVSFRLELGMRQKLVPYIGDALNEQISSVRVGANVGVALFRHADYGGGYETYFSSQSALPDSINDQVSSLIVFPRQLLQPIGATLVDARWDGENHWFYPAAEYLGTFLTSYPALGSMDDDANRVIFTPTDPQSPAYHKISTTLFESPHFQGRYLVLPGADEWIPDDSTFYMNWYSFDDSASSLRVSWRGGMLYGIMSPPSPNYSFKAEYTAIPTPLQRMYPIQSMPIGLGSVAENGYILSVSVFAAFDEPVNVYAGFANRGFIAVPDAPFIDISAIKTLRPDGTIQPLSAGIVPWRTGVTPSWMVRRLSAGHSGRNQP